MNAELSDQPSDPTPPKDGSEGQGADTNGHAHGGEANPAKKVRRGRANAGGAAAASFGAKLVRLRALSTTGGQVISSGARRIGHGRLMIAAEEAQQAIAKLEEAVQELLGQQPCDLRRIIALMRLQKDFNRQLMDIGIAQVRAASAAVNHTADTDLTIPFPAGTPKVVPTEP